MQSMQWPEDTGARGHASDRKADEWAEIRCVRLRVTLAMQAAQPTWREFRVQGKSRPSM